MSTANRCGSCHLYRNGSPEGAETWPNRKGQCLAGVSKDTPDGSEGPAPRHHRAAVCPRFEKAPIDGGQQ